MRPPFKTETAISLLLYIPQFVKSQRFNIDLFWKRYKVYPQRRFLPGTVQQRVSQGDIYTDLLLFLHKLMISPLLVNVYLMSKKFIANHKKEPCCCLPRESRVSLEDKKRHEKCGHCYDIHKNVSCRQKTWRKKPFKCMLFQRLLPCYQGGVTISKKYLLLRGHIFT